ncbi:Hint domain-containing protein [Tabrizicola sp.]|uniref:Hint domain-containing protein n=1 Tax=Tabrizicola sp. TaxID=2005166 RepID=UPI002737377A|nr:Hint domain-containing protein [Tabrizicola sp.]MDP3195763.1 Hint domain-containing protein [Tabrizicola sp.]
MIEFDKFRRLKDAFSGLMRPEGAEKVEPRLAWYLPGFSGKSRVSTVFGELPIEALRVRDDLRTYSGASAQVQLVDRIHLDEDFLRKQPSALPLRIPADSFGPGRPSQDMLLSPGQEISSDVHVVTNFVKAGDLRNRFNPDLAQSVGMTYIRFHCGAPAIVRIDGVWVRVRP